jgi:hypothetical protein
MFSTWMEFLVETITQSSQWRPQLMGNILQQASLGRKENFDTLRYPVKCLSQGSNFVTAA